MIFHRGNKLARVALSRRLPLFGQNVDQNSGPPAAAADGPQSECRRNECRGKGAAVDAVFEAEVDTFAAAEDLGIELPEKFPNGAHAR